MEGQTSDVFQLSDGRRVKGQDLLSRSNGLWRQCLRLPGCGTPDSWIVELSAQDDAFPNGSTAHLEEERWITALAQGQQPSLVEMKLG
jgi:hypothetical protein